MKATARHEPGADPLDEVLAPFGSVGRERIAEIHGTVDLERALAALGRPNGDATAAVAEPLIGARVVLIEQTVGPILALAEPTTEGRLAASLARHGEGPIGDYVALPDVGTLDGVRDVAREAGIALSAVARGPFGPGVLVLGGPIWGRQVIVVERRSLPSEP